MKNKFRQTLALTLLAMHAVAGNAQDIDTGIFSYTPTPQTRAFIRYGNTTVNHNIGTITVNIPIYTYKDNDFELPISASYTTQGLMPGQQTGILGLGWFLNCGGSVTRTIHGVPDDHIADDGTHGLLTRASYDEDDILNISKGELNSDGMRHYLVDHSETTSDVYHFRINGHSGTFHFDGNREPHVYDTGGNHGTYTIIPLMPTNSKLNGFVIKTGDGYEYTFGCNSNTPDINSTERSLNGWFTGSAIFTFNKQSLTANPIVTWNLTGIKAPNGRTVTFQYETVKSTIGSYINSESPNNPFLVTTFTPALFVNDEQNIDHKRSVSIVQTSYLSKILVNDTNTEINFAMSLKECYDRPATKSDINGIESDHFITQNLKKLDSITVKNSDHNIHSTTFQYQTKGNRLLLDKVHTDGVGDHTMNYYTDGTFFPSISTPDVDFWGFYNGRRNSYETVNSTEVKENNNEYIANESRNPDWHYSLLGCLKRITYPTHGFSTFEYEPNRSKKILLKREFGNETISPMPDDMTAQQAPVSNENAYRVDIYPYSILFGESDECGGVRIARICDYDNNGTYRSRSYTYYDGIVNSFPRYSLASTGTYQIYSPLIEFPSNSLDKQHLTYSRVKEAYADGSYTIYHYTNYETYPDEYKDQVQRKLFTNDDIEAVFEPAFINNILRMPNSKHSMRGKIKEITHYDKHDNIVKQSSYEYAAHDTTYTAYIVMSGSCANSVKRYTGDVRLISVNESEYLPEGNLINWQHFIYDNKGRIVNHTVTYPDSIRLHTLTEYCNDSLRHVLSCPTSMSIVEEKNGTMKLTGAVKYDYALFGNQLLPTTTRKALLDADTPYRVQESTLPYIKLQHIASYDTQGNPTEVIDKHGVSTAYLWGYGGMYPVARAQGMSSEQIKSLAGITGNAPLPGALTESQRASLQSNHGTLVDIYEHKPLVGITRHYKPDGLCTHYNYDTFGRLTGIGDNEGIIEKYNYILDSRRDIEFNIDNNHILNDSIK